MKRYWRKAVRVLALALAVAALFCVSAFATTGGGSGDVSGAISQAWKGASAQIKSVVNDVVFPALDMILAIAFFGKLGMSYFDYRKHGQFEWTGPAILFACLVFTLTAPNYIWGIVGL